MGDTRTELVRGAAELLHDVNQFPFKLGDVIGSAVGQQPFRQVPDSFVRIELGSVGRERLEPKPGEAMTQVPNGGSFVGSTVIPEDDDNIPQVVEQVTKELTDLRVFDVLLGMEVIVQSKPISPRAHRDARDHRDFVPTIKMAVDGCQSARRPGSVDAGHQEKSTLVYEDEMGAQPRCVFFTRGHSFFFQRSIASSSRSRARRSGFWWLHFRRCMRRATWLR